MIAIASTFSWFGRNRRLENLAEILAAFVKLVKVPFSATRLLAAGSITAAH
jgi:hypothetical protein